MYDVDDVLPDYIRSALWSSMDWADANGGEPMDANYGPEDIAPSALDTMRREVHDFLALIERERPGVFEAMANTLWSDPGQVGHDLWLTRNGHGTGFWDRYYWYPARIDPVTGQAFPEHGDRVAAELGDFLATWAKTYGSADLYVGDDGSVYQM